MSAQVFSDLVVADLRSASEEGLLTAHAALTHRIHECKGSTVAGQCDGPCADLRAQRNLVAGEVKRRMRVGPQVVGLWNRLDGWIPGAAYGELAEVLGVHVDLLKHYDQPNRKRHTP